MDNPEIDQCSATGIFQYNIPKIITAIKNKVQTWTKQKIIPSPIKLFSPGAAVCFIWTARRNSKLGNCTKQKQKVIIHLNVKI